MAHLSGRSPTWIEFARAHGVHIQDARAQLFDAAERVRCASVRTP